MRLSTPIAPIFLYGNSNTKHSNNKMSNNKITNRKNKTLMYKIIQYVMKMEMELFGKRKQTLKLHGMFTQIPIEGLKSCEKIDRNSQIFTRICTRVSGYLRGLSM